MVSAGRPVAFVATADRGRARSFYEGTLGLALLSDDAFALVFDLGEITLRVTVVEQLTPQTFTVLGWQVDDIGSTVRHLTAAGVTLERYPFLEQDAAGVWTAPSGTRVAWFKDPDGNTLSVSEHPGDEPPLNRPS